MSTTTESTPRKKRDKKKLCTCCGLKPRKGRMLCSSCYKKNSDGPSQGVALRTVARSPAA